MDPTSPWEPLKAFLRESHGGEVLTEPELTFFASSLTLEYHPKDKELFVEGQSQLENIYVFLEGEAEMTWENDVLPAPEKQSLGKGDIFGAVSVLLDQGLARRSLKTLSDCFLYALPKASFLELCQKNSSYRQCFTAYLSEEEHHLSLLTRIQERVQQRAGAWMGDTMSSGAMAKKEFLSVLPETPIQEAMTKMLEAKLDSILVMEQNQLLGLCTYGTFCRRVILEGVSVKNPISQVMETSVMTVNETMPMLESLMLMARRGFHHLPVLNPKNEVVGMLSTRDMPQTRRESGLMLLQKIRETKHAKDLVFARVECAKVVGGLHRDGFAVESITRMIAQVNDAVLEKVITETLEDVGEAPCPFAFVVFGSEGREEQTLVVDQDNGIVFEHDDQHLEPRRSFFLKFGKKVCDRLNQLGYPHCKGGVMASEPKCCLSEKEWFLRIKKWIDTPNPEAMLNAQIYFDMRCVFGEKNKVQNLMVDVLDHLKEHGQHYFHAATKNCINSAVPLGMFQQFVTATKGSQRGTLDIKKVMNHYVEYARLLSLKHGIATTNTVARFKALRALGILSEKHYRDVTHAYENTLHLRLQIQEQEILNGKEGHNFFDPSALGKMDQRVLKASLSLIYDCQRRLQRELCIPGLP